MKTKLKEPYDEKWGRETQNISEVTSIILKIELYCISFLFFFFNSFTHFWKSLPISSLNHDMGMLKA